MTTPSSGKKAFAEIKEYDGDRYIVIGGLPFLPKKSIEEKVSWLNDLHGEAVSAAVREFAEKVEKKMFDCKCGQCLKCFYGEEFRAMLKEAIR